MMPATKTETWHNGQPWCTLHCLHSSTLVCNVIVMGDVAFALRSHVPPTTLVQHCRYPESTIRTFIYMLFKSPFQPIENEMVEWF